MKVGGMRKELESYGISTKSFLEKRELVQALEKARAAGTKPKKEQETTVNGDQKQEKPKQEKKQPANGKSEPGASRAERLQQEMEKANGMKVLDLRKALEARGVSTKSFFEKTEFVKAYAEAVVDGKTGGGGSGSQEAEEEFDESYRDVTMLKMDARDPRLLQGTLIDVKASRR
jgi:hypothetical protein